MDGLTVLYIMDLVETFYDRSTSILQESPPYPEDAAPNIRGQLPARVRGVNVSPAAVDNKRRKSVHLD